MDERKKVEEFLLALGLVSGFVMISFPYFTTCSAANFCYLIVTQIS